MPSSRWLRSPGAAGFQICPTSIHRPSQLSVYKVTWSRTPRISPVLFIEPSRLNLRTTVPVMSDKTDPKTGQEPKLGILPHPAVRRHSILGEEFIALTTTCRASRNPTIPKTLNLHNSARGSPPSPSWKLSRLVDLTFQTARP